MSWASIELVDLSTPKTLASKVSDARFELMRALLKNLFFDSFNNTLTNYGQFVLQRLSKDMTAHDDGYLIIILEQLNSHLNVKHNVNLLVNETLIAYKKDLKSDSYSSSDSESKSYTILRDIIVEQRLSMAEYFRQNVNLRSLKEISLELLFAARSVDYYSDPNSIGVQLLILKTLAAKTNKLASMIEAREFDGYEELIEELKQVLLRFNEHNYKDRIIPDICQALSELVPQIKLDVSIMLDYKRLVSVFVTLSNLNSSFYQPVIHEMEGRQSNLAEYKKFKSALNAMRSRGSNATDTQIRPATFPVMGGIKRRSPETIFTKHYKSLVAEQALRLALVRPNKKNHDFAFQLWELMLFRESGELTAYGEVWYRETERLRKENGISYRESFTKEKLKDKETRARFIADLISLYEQQSQLEEELAEARFLTFSGEDPRLSELSKKEPEFLRIEVNEGRATDSILYHFDFSKLSETKIASLGKDKAMTAYDISTLQMAFSEYQSALQLYSLAQSIIPCDYNIRRLVASSIKEITEQIKLIDTFVSNYDGLETAKKQPFWPKLKEVLLTYGYFMECINRFDFEKLRNIDFDEVRDVITAVKNQSPFFGALLQQVLDFHEKFIKNIPKLIEIAFARRCGYVLSQLHDDFSEILAYPNFKNMQAMYASGFVSELLLNIPKHNPLVQASLFKKPSLTKELGYIKSCLSSKGPQVNFVFENDPFTWLIEQLLFLVKSYSFVLGCDCCLSILNKITSLINGVQNATSEEISASSSVPTTRMTA